MIKKNYSKERRSCLVTFELPLQVNAKTACVCGEFNNWDVMANPMKRRKDGSFTLAIPLKPGRSYRFRYLLDDIRWENDWTADSYVRNAFGSDDSVVQL